MTTLDDVVGAAAAAHPHPNQQAPQIVADVMARHGGGDDSADAPAPTTAPQAPAQRDNKGNAYDAALHESPARITARGTWAKRRGPMALDEFAPLTADGATAVAPTAPAPPPVDHRAMAQAWCDKLFAVAILFRGPHWEPSEAERRDVSSAMERWMRDSGWAVDLPPGWALLLSVGLYALPRVQVDAAQRKAQADDDGDDADNGGEARPANAASALGGSVFNHMAA